MLSDREFFERETARRGDVGRETRRSSLRKTIGFFGYGLTLVSCDAIGDGGLEQINGCECIQWWRKEN